MFCTSIIGGALILTWVILKNKNFFYIFSKTWKRDLRAAQKFAKLNLYFLFYYLSKKTIPKLFKAVVRKQPNKIAFYFENQKWTYTQVDKMSDNVGNFFKNAGFKRGDHIALLMENRPEFVCLWLGLSKIGIVTALLNTNLKSKQLDHCMKVADCKALIFGSQYLDSAKAFTQDNLKLFQFNTEDSPILDGAIDLKQKLNMKSEGNIDEEISLGNRDDNLLYIYTSGTTGLPKAAIINHMRYIFMTKGMFLFTGIRQDDIVYNPLPLYHSSGGACGVGLTLIEGVTLALREKFSARSFWTDCEKYNCTVAQYIGEICRYILAANSKNLSKIKHSVRLIVGNGLKPQIWKKFVDKFDVQVCELYGSTEGNVNLINMDAKQGAVGFIPPFVEALYPAKLIKYAEDTYEPIRDANGFCIKSQPNESGLLVGKIENLPHRSFLGYADKKSTETKILHNVFKTGDSYFNSGDIFIQDELGYFYFKDRTGDTFRWKGENVSTTEVEAEISNIIGFKDAFVYGVEVPNTEGRAGMVAILDAEKNLDFDTLLAGLKDKLPSYAVPLFIRILETTSLTGTFKLIKTEYQNQGFDMSRVKDDLYFLDAKEQKYVKLTQEMYNDIVSGVVRL